MPDRAITSKAYIIFHSYRCLSALIYRRLNYYVINNDIRISLSKFHYIRFSITKFPILFRFITTNVTSHVRHTRRSIENSKRQKIAWNRWTSERSFEKRGRERADKLIWMSWQVKCILRSLLRFRDLGYRFESTTFLPFRATSRSHKSFPHLGIKS